MVSSVPTSDVRTVLHRGSTGTRFCDVMLLARDIMSLLGIGGAASPACISFGGASSVNKTHLTINLEINDLVHKIPNFEYECSVLI